MALDPVFAGAVHETVAEVTPAVATTFVGTPGTTFVGGVCAVGVTALEGAESGPAPALLVAWTSKVYVVPLVSPFTVALVL
jgi:hypothetical protein